MVAKVIGIIIARGGSKGLSGKNLRILDGETLIQRAVRQGLESKVLDRLIVSTDDDAIAASAKTVGAEIPFMRPSYLAEDLSTTEETLQHALLTYEQLSGMEFDIAVFLTATDVFRDPSWIAKAVDVLIDNPSLESVFVGHQTHKNFWEKKEDGTWSRLRDWMSVYSSRQVRQSIVREDTGLACASRAWLWREGKRIGDKVEIIVNDDDFTSIDIHHHEDLMLAQAAIDIRKKIASEMENVDD